MALATGTTWPVTSCLDDGGAETLRARVTNAASGDTVDLSNLSCPGATISLAADGTHITVAQDSLAIVGPAATTLAIDGSALAKGAQYDSNIFDHTGAGTLTVSHVTLTGGHVKTLSVDASGGCIRSAFDVELAYATVTGCHAYASTNYALGGGVFAAHDLTLTHSTISGNTAKTFGGTAKGGGVRSGHGLAVLSSTLSGNVANASLGVGGALSLAATGGTLSITSSSIVGNHATGTTARGGALYVGAQTGTITASTISGNMADTNGGGAYFYARPIDGSSFDVINSTISGNHAGGLFGGIYIGAETVHLSNTTIAFNSANGANPGAYLFVRKTMAATLQSMLIANNSGTGGDLGVYGPVTFNADTPGNANNLIGATGVTGLPADTLFGACPLLGPLRDNGGPTETHALWSGSPAIDAGNVNGLSPSITTDQRGGPYARVSGITADIGAYEVQQDDIVFGGGFDGC